MMKTYMWSVRMKIEYISRLKIINNVRKYLELFINKLITFNILISFFKFILIIYRDYRKEVDEFINIVYTCSNLLSIIALCTWIISYLGLLFLDGNRQFYIRVFKLIRKQAKEDVTIDEISNLISNERLVTSRCFKYTIFKRYNYLFLMVSIILFELLVQLHECDFY